VALRGALWKYNLQLNEEKTNISHSRLPYLERWKLEFDLLSLSLRGVKRQRRDLYRLIEMTLHFCSEAKSAAPAIWTCRRLARLKVYNENFGIVLDAMIRFARDYPICTSEAAAFLVNNQSLCREAEFSKRISAWVTSTIRMHSRNGYDFETAWSLLVAGVLRISIEESDLPPEDVLPGSIVFSLLGLLRERGLLTASLSRWPWRAEFKRTGIHGSNWLPFYESVRRNWTHDKNIRDAVIKDPIFSRMLSDNVTFLEDDVFDASKIDITKRIFKKVIEESEGYESNAVVGIDNHAKPMSLLDSFLTRRESEYE
jgi:hypothetical protein